jgi:hypothetical protein
MHFQFLLRMVIVKFHVIIFSNKSVSYVTKAFSYDYNGYYCNNYYAKYSKYQDCYRFESHCVQNICCKSVLFAKLKFLVKNYSVKM